MYLSVYFQSDYPFYSYVFFEILKLIFSCPRIMTRTPFHPNKKKIKFWVKIEKLRTSKDLPAKTITHDNGITEVGKFWLAMAHATWLTINDKR